jgi:carbamoyl-phosphate synthase small subunit
MAANSNGGWDEPRPTAVLVLADGTVLEGFGIGAIGEASGEVCFNTAMTGYQEILTDPSYAGQIITFTFPHIGNVGANEEDVESLNAASSAGARGIILSAPVTEPASWRATRHLDCLAEIARDRRPDRRGHACLDGLIRDRGMPNAIIAHDPAGDFDLAALTAACRPRCRPWLASTSCRSWPARSVRPGTRRAGPWARVSAGRTARSTTWWPSTTA